MPFGLKKIEKRGRSGKSTFSPSTCPETEKWGLYNWLALYSYFRKRVINSKSIEISIVRRQISKSGGKVFLLSLPLTNLSKKVDGSVISGSLGLQDSTSRTRPEKLAENMATRLTEFDYSLLSSLGIQKGNESIAQSKL